MPRRVMSCSASKSAVLERWARRPKSALNPPEAAVVLCVDEKSQIQALEPSAPTLPLMPGVPERQT